MKLSASTMSTVLRDRGEDPFDVMEVLQDVQDTFGYVPEEAICRVSETMNVPLIEVFRLANFYKSFALKPRGRHLITVCMGTACHVQGAPKLVDNVCSVLNIRPGETTNDGLFTVETVNCLGACALAPLLIMDGEYYEQMTPTRLGTLIDSVKNCYLKRAANE